MKYQINFMFKLIVVNRGLLILFGFGIVFIATQFYMDGIIHFGTCYYRKKKTMTWWYDALTPSNVDNISKKRNLLCLLDHSNLSMILILNLLMNEISYF